MFKYRKGSILTMQQIERSVYSYLNEKLATANPRSNKIREGALANLEKYTKEKLGKSLDEYIAGFKNSEDALEQLQLWVNWNSKRISPSTVRHYFILIKPYLYYKGIKFHPDDVKQEIRFPKVLENEKHGITQNEIKRLFEYLNPTKKALYLCQLSSAMRIGELMRLRVKQLDFSLDRIMVKIPAEHAKSGKSRITFFSKEAAKYLKPLLKNLDNNDLVFTKNENWVNARNAEIVMIRWTKKAGLKDITTHSMRAYFITQTSRIDPNMAKKFAGQKVYLGEYDRPTFEKMLEVYLTFEPELLIFENKQEPIDKKELENIVSFEVMKAIAALKPEEFNAIRDKLGLSVEEASKMKYPIK